MRLFDLHCDTLSVCEQMGCSLLDAPKHLNIARGLKSEAYFQVFAAFIPDELRGDAAVNYGCKLLDIADRDAVLPCVQSIVTPADISTAVQEHRCGMIKAVEGGAILGGDTAMLDELKVRQVRLMTLTWNGTNELGNGCFSTDTSGLTPFGKSVVRRMEELEMLVDVSHLNEAGFWDVASISHHPFIATHSLSMSVNAHPRNLTDAQFDCIRERGGLVGLNLCDEHLGEASFAAFERHLAHFLLRDGEKAVALGCDFDGTDLPKQWNGLDTLSALEKQLLADGFGRETVDRLFYQNAYDFFCNL